MSLLAGKEWRGMFHNRRKDGSIYWESASISPLRDERGNITHFIAVKEDITAQKRAEDQLRMNATVFDTTAEGIMVTDEENRIKTVNPAFSRITGYSQEDVLGHMPNILSSGRHSKSFYEKLWESVLQKGYWSGEIWTSESSIS
ncbi:MAG: PAS domain S-box protein [Candidatus Thiodiazotropha sp. L084R]